jgi:hypothetical protein
MEYTNRPVDFRGHFFTIQRYSTNIGVRIYLTVHKLFLMFPFFLLISQLLGNLEFGSVTADAEYTLFDAREGNVIVNTTRSVSDLTSNWTQAIHTSRMYSI